MVNTENKILDVLELLNEREWKSTNTVYVEGAKAGIYKQRASYERNLNVLLEKGYVELKENEIKDAVRRFWRRKNVCKGH